MRFVGGETHVDHGGHQEAAGKLVGVVKELVVFPADKDRDGQHRGKNDPGRRHDGDGKIVVVDDPGCRRTARTRA